MTLSAAHPYEKNQRYVTLRGAEDIPRQLVNYLLDLPLPSCQPPASNEYPRARLMKYLYHDGVSPLDEPLPTPEQKLSLVFDPLRQTDPPDKAKLYRVFPQAYIAQTEYVGKTILRVYMGQTVARSVYRCELSVVFECLTNVVYEGAAGIALSRTFAMECALMEALNGVNINGVGTLYFDRTQHPGCGSWQIDDRGTNVGRRLVLGLTWGAS